MLTLSSECAAYRHFTDMMANILGLSESPLNLLLPHLYRQTR